MKKTYSILLILFCLIGCLAAQTPRMMFGDTTRIGAPFSKDPHVIHFNGKYLIYYSIPGKKGVQNSGWNIGIAESKDLIHWTKVGDITPDTNTGIESKGMCAPCALIRDGKVHLFYQSYGNGKKDAICHAISTDGIKFQRDPSNPIFRPTGDWNCGRAIDAEICKFKGKYYLYFATRDPAYKKQILGVAVAPGNTDFSRKDWTLAVDSTILQPYYAWEGECIEGPSTVVKNGKIYMFYAGAYNNYPQQLGVAVSTDGLHWKRLFKEPFVANGKPGEWNSSESGHPHLFLDNNGRTYLFYQGNNDKGKTWFITNEEIFWKKGIPYRKTAK